MTEKMALYLICEHVDSHRWEEPLHMYTDETIMELIADIVRRWEQAREEELTNRQYP